MDTGPEIFIKGLRDLGYSPETLPGKLDHVVIDYEVQSGKFAGKKLRHGFIVPPDFSAIPPTGPHISEDIHTIKGGGEHPTGGVHRDHAKPFQEVLGGEWQYWSRPFPDWGASKKTVATYMIHIWHLWESQ
jgi:hypothetical protein